MSEVASRWALVASLALHAAVLALGLRRPRPQSPPSWLTDFWGGKTFEVPDLPSDQGEGEELSSDDQSTNEIKVDGLDPSTDTSRIASPPAPAEGQVPARRPTRAARAVRASSPSSAPAASHGNGPGGTFGAEGSAPGVRDLLRSFVRAAPIVASGDPAWGVLPLGSAGAADVILTLDEEGKPHVAGSLAAPAHLKRLVFKTVSVMSGGRFGVLSGDGTLSQQKLHIALTVTQEVAPSQDQAVTGGVFALRFEPPDDRNVSHAFFTLASGRRVDIAVRPLAR